MPLYHSIRSKFVYLTIKLIEENKIEINDKPESAKTQKLKK